MPALPEVKKSTSNVDIGSQDHALAVARVLGGTSKREDSNRFLTVIRTYLRIHKKAKQEFVEWYESVPAVDSDEDRPEREGKKKKKKKRDEDE